MININIKNTCEPQYRPAWPRGEAVCLALTVLIAAGLRFAWLNRHSLWFDEVVTMRLALAPDLSELARLLPKIDAVGAPLYPLLLHYWIGLFGSSDLAARLLSAVISLATVTTACWVGTVAYNRRVGLWCAWLVALCPAEVQYAQEVRMYSILVLVTCLCWGCLFSFRSSAPWWKQFAFTLWLIALPYTHPLGGLMVVALAVGYVLDRPRSQLEFRSWILIHIVVASVLALWVNRYLDHPPDLKEGPKTWSGYITWLRVFTGGNGTVAWSCLALIVLGLFTRLPRAANPDQGLTESCHRPWLDRYRFDDLQTARVVLAWLIIPPVLMIAYSRLRHPVFGPVRYMVFVGPAYLLLLARSLSKLPVCAGASLALAGAVLAGGMIQDRVYNSVAKSNWRGLAQVIKAIDPNAPLVHCCSEPHIYYYTIHYYLVSNYETIYLYKYIEKLKNNPRARAQRSWMVVDQLDGINPPPALMDLFDEPARSWRFGRLTLTYRRVR